MRGFQRGIRDFRSILDFRMGSTIHRRSNSPKGRIDGPADQPFRNLAESLLRDFPLMLRFCSWCANEHILVCDMPECKRIVLWDRHCANLSQLSRQKCSRLRQTSNRETGPIRRMRTRGQGDVHHESDPDRAASQAKISKLPLRTDTRVLSTGSWSSRRSSER
jgi:hypothetical protein